LDTTPIFGRGAVKDTYNLLADGMVAVLRVLTLLSAGTPHPVFEVEQEHARPECHSVDLE
jgi:hypothetical protein